MVSIPVVVMWWNYLHFCCDQDVVSNSIVTRDATIELVTIEYTANVDIYRIIV